MTEYPTTDKERSEFWGVKIRTLFRWKGDGAPLDNYDDMLAWLSTRKNLPRSVLEKIKLPAQENVSSPVVVGVAGAAAALKRLEATELQAFGRMQTALARGNPLEIREARESWLKISESLRRYDLMIEANRRDAGELVPVTEIDKFIRSFCSYMQVVLTYRAESLVNEIMGKPEMEMYRALRDLFNKTLFHGVLGYIKGGGKTNPDPRLVEYAGKCLDEQCGWWAKQGGWAEDRERDLVALIKWAQEQKP